MIDDTIDALARLGVDPSWIHREYFAATAPTAPPASTELTAILDGQDITVTLDQDTTLTDPLERAGQAPPTTCKSGTCSTCVAQLLEGRVTMRANHALSSKDVADGLVLSCQAEPITPVVVIDYDTAR